MKILAVLTILALASIGCNRDTTKTIGVVPKGRSHIFWQSVHAGAVKAAREHGMKVEWNGPATESDFNAQLQIVDAMVNKHLDAIVLAPIDKTAMVSVVDRAAKQGVPVVIFDSPVDTPSFVAQVATDNYQAGALAAERMGTILKGKGDIAIVAVQAGAASTMAREQGFEDAIRKNWPGIKILDKRYGEAVVATSLKVAENMLTAHPTLVGIFGSNESSTVGTAQALKGRRNTQVKLVGFDAGPTLEADLKAGIIDSLVVQNPFKMGYDAVTAAAAKLKGETPVKIQNLAPRLVTREDLSNPEVQAQLNPDLKPYLN